MALAIEVLPVPGGPQRTMEGRRLDSIAERRRVLVPRRWSCPTTSSMVRGRMRSDKGWWSLSFLLSWDGCCSCGGGVFENNSLGRLERCSGVCCCSC